jgi:hypothetical protein
MTARQARNEMLNAGAVALFDKPIPLADFLDAVERSLGLVRTIFPPESNREADQHGQTLSELLSGFRQQSGADAVFLISDRGRVLARAGDLYDSSMEVSLLSAMMAIFSAGLKVSRFIHQETLENYHVFRSEDHDLILIPVDASHALMVAGNHIATADRILPTVQGMLMVRDNVEGVLKSLGVAPTTLDAEPTVIPEPEPLTVAPPEPEPEVDLDALFATASKNATVKDIDAFWDDAVEKTGNIRTNPDVISFEEASKLGLTPGKTMPVRLTGPLKPDDPLTPPK